MLHVRNPEVPGKKVNIAEILDREKTFKGWYNLVKIIWIRICGVHYLAKDNIEDEAKNSVFSEPGRSVMNRLEDMDPDYTQMKEHKWA